jgi:hypothetical protein
MMQLIGSDKLLFRSVVYIKVCKKLFILLKINFCFTIFELFCYVDVKNKF